MAIPETRAELQREIEKRKEEIKVLEEKVKQQNALSPYVLECREVATDLHSLLCCANHIDGCGWYYDNGDWNEYSRRLYFKKAGMMLQHFTASQINLFCSLARDSATS